MTINLLEELEIPHPPYRMARPVASLASADEPPAHRADIMSEEALEREFESALPAEPKPEEKPVIEQPVEQPETPEQIDQSVESKAEDAKQRIDATPSPDVAAKEEAKNEIEEARIAFQASMKNKAAEYSGEKKNLGSLEEEYESAEAALKRAETEKKPQEVQRLTKLTQQYSDAVEHKAAEAAHPAGPKIGDIVTEGKASARVLEVNAEGRPTRLETIEEPKSDTRIESPPVANEAATDSPASEGEFRRQKFDAKTPTEMKKQVTRDQSAALKENEIRAAGAPDESLDILREAHEGKGPTSHPQEEKGPQEDVLDVLREGQPATAPKLEHTETQDFSVAQSFDQLRELLITSGEIIGTTSKTYKANELIGTITDIRDLLRKTGGDLSAVREMLRLITPAGGLREKVGNLLEQEAASLSANPEVATPVVEPVFTEEKKWQPTRITPEEQAALRAAYAKTTEQEQAKKKPVPAGPESRREFEPLAEVLRTAWDNSKTKFRLESVWDRALAGIFNDVAKKHVSGVHWNAMWYERRKKRAEQMEEQAKASRSNLKKYLGIPAFYEWQAKRARGAMLGSYERLKYHDELRRKWEKKRNFRCHEIADRVDLRLRPYEEKARDCSELSRDAAVMLKRWDTERDRLTKKLADVEAEGHRMGTLFGLVMDKETRMRVDAVRAQISSIQTNIRERRAYIEKMNARRVRAQRKADGWHTRKERVLQFGRNPSREGIATPKPGFTDQTAARTEEAA